MSFQQCIFPNCLKNKNYPQSSRKMNKANFRPVSMLVCFSETFEKLYCDQLLDLFNKFVVTFLSVFGKGYRCETVWVKMIEGWRKCLSEHKVVAAMLVDFSKAFDCLSRRLLLAKVSAYGSSNDCCDVFMSYLSERKMVTPGAPVLKSLDIFHEDHHLVLFFSMYSLAIFLCYRKCVQLCIW